TMSALAIVTALLANPQKLDTGWLILKRVSLYWGSSIAHADGFRDTNDRRPTRASISDRSDVTASSRSDASSPDL
ncbi:hypothetical protein N7526_005175, partial [Penicillium atrosanguineum]